MEIPQQTIKFSLTSIKNYIDKQIKKVYEYIKNDKTKNDNQKELLSLREEINHLSYVSDANTYANGHCFENLLHACLKGDTITFKYLISKFTFKERNGGKFGNGMCITLDSQRNSIWLDNTYKLIKNTCISGNIDIMSHLVSLGVNINLGNQSNFDNCMGLFWAANHNKYNMVKYLLENGAILGYDEYITSDKPEGHEIKKLLIKYGAKKVKLRPC